MLCPAKLGSIKLYIQMMRFHNNMPAFASLLLSLAAPEPVMVYLSFAQSIEIATTSNPVRLAYRASISLLRPL